MSFLSPARWTRQPPYRAELDPSNQVTRGIIGAGYAGYESYGPGLTLVNGATYQPTLGGMALDCVHASSHYATASRNLDPSSNVFTLMVAWYTGSLANNLGLFQSNGSNNQAGVAMNCNTTGAISCTYGDNAGTGTTTNRRVFQTATGVGVTGRLMVAAFAITGATTGTCFVNGIGRTLTTSGSASSYSGSSATTARIGARVSGTDEYGTKDILAWAVWDRAISDAALRDVTLNPWQLWRAPQRQFWLNTLSAGTTGRVKVYLGGSWVTKPLKVYNGSSWVEKKVKHYNGSTWVESNG